jgi:hypothetical protein
MTTEQGNEIIWQYVHPGVVDDRPDAIMIPYHKDWNWLIPVIKQVIADLSPATARVMNPYKREMARNTVIDALNKLEIQPLWEAVVSSIQLINGNE